MAESVTSRPAPETMTTYKPADAAGWSLEYGWVTDLDYFDDDDEPIELIEERWERVAGRVGWVLPCTLYSCTVDLDCDEDATGWVSTGGTQTVPVQACDEHAKKYKPVEEVL